MTDELRERARELKRELRETCGVARGEARVVLSPYRVCPIGAHVDHQLGLVCGMAINRSVLLAYAPSGTGEVRLRSRDFPGEVRFSLDDIPPARGEDWGNYVRGAALALKREHTLKQGIVGLVAGSMPIGGLSSSAAVGIAYLFALEEANSLALDAKANIRLMQVIENEYIGLNNGILDQSMILLSERGRLVSLDCLTEEGETVAPGAAMPQFAIAVVYSGVSEALVSTDYNRRVAECEEAARLLLRAAGLEAPPGAKLRHVPREVFEAYARELPHNLRRRATHFFGELKRVEQGVAAWRAGDLTRFGELVSASGESSIVNYECGSPELTEIYRLLLACEGVYGARFSGAGFRGSCIALCSPEAEEEIRRAMEEEYARKFPKLAGSFEVHLCSPDDGARFV